MRNVSLLNGRVVGCALAGTLAALAFATPAAAADFNTGGEAYAPPPAYAPAPAYAPPVAAPAYVVPYAPVPYYRPYVWGYPYGYGRPYWGGYWGPRYAGWYGRPWGWRPY